MAIRSSWTLSKTLILMNAACGLLGEITGAPALPFAPRPLWLDPAADDHMGDKRDKLDADKCEYALSQYCPLLAVTLYPLPFPAPDTDLPDVESLVQEVE